MGFVLAIYLYAKEKKLILSLEYLPLYYVDLENIKVAWKVGVTAMLGYRVTRVPAQGPESQSQTNICRAGNS